MTTPDLQPPQEISSDGREIWDWAARLGQASARANRCRELAKAIRDGENECGSCTKWMTDACPRERHDNKLGRKVGPSCKTIKCDQFVMKKWDAERIAGLKAELAQLQEPQ